MGSSGPLQGPSPQQYGPTGVSSALPDAEEAHVRPDGTVLQVTSNGRLEVFGFEGSATLRLVTLTGEIRATSRTYNLTQDGTYGQFIGASGADDGFGFQMDATLIQLSSSPDFRTNIGLVNLAEGPVEVEIHLYNGDGTMLGVVARQLGPFEMKQVDRTFQSVTSQPVDSGYAVVKMLTTGGEVHAYASVVDNGSNDPVYVAAQPLSDTSPFM